MDIQIKLAKAISDCEEAMNILSAINAKHHLLCYDGTGQTVRKLDELTDKLLSTFGPGECSADSITDQELLCTFQNFHRAILAAIEYEALLNRL